MKDCAHHFWSSAWRIRLLSFFSTAIVGLLAPTGCVVAPENWQPNSDSVHEILWGPQQGGERESCEAASGPTTAADPASGETCDCPPCEEKHRPKCHLPHCHLYNPEAGIFNFCIPPQCINEPPPLPPGRFFPVPVRPAFAPRQLPTYAPPYAM